MLYWKYSSNRIFFINEYWVFIPAGLLANYFIIRKIRSDREMRKQLKRLTEQIEREKKLRRILFLTLGLNECIHLLNRGGGLDQIDSDYIKSFCKIEEGVNFLDDKRLRNMIHNLYRYKRKGKIIYITATALCHIANQYGRMFFAFPVALGDFGLTNLYQTLRKGLAVILVSGTPPLLVFYGVPGLISALILGTLGVRLAVNNLDYIPLSPVDLTKDLQPRIPGELEVVVVNNRKKLIMSNPVEENKECWLFDQRVSNQNCKIKPTDIPDAIDLASPNLKYEETVNMQDVTGLDRVAFTDHCDLGHIKPKKVCKAKEVRFPDVFGDSGAVGENEGWDTCENEYECVVPEKRHLRTRNKP